MRLFTVRKIKTAAWSIAIITIIARLHPAWAGPVSTNYQLKQYGFGSGGSQNSTSTNYATHTTTGETETGKLASTNFKIGAGLSFTLQAEGPPAPTFTNPASYYNKLKLVVNKGGNASDATYAVAISTDNFVSDTKYVQSDMTVGAGLGLEDWMTYTAWGGTTGVNIIGLAQNTTYYVKSVAKKGKYTQTGYGPTASATTVNPSLTFDIDVSATDTDTEPPFGIQFSDLLAGSVIDSPKKVWVDLATNGESGGKVYIYGQNAGLSSATTSYTIPSATGDLTSASEGFGAQGASATQTTGGPLTMSAPYNGTSNTVGITDTAIRDIFSSTNPITGGRGSFALKAKSSSVTPASDDYSETLTVIASASF
ncbi:hypothetical protein HY949_04820 [Candidatus Gottesmanbacteria bacterium]|nr:hypothetical protein [Candidatus Gottesmanbacteria bacterium]